MTRTVVAIYDNFQTANSAVRDLIDSGYPRDKISLVAANERGEYTETGAQTIQRTDTEVDTTDAVADETGAGAGVGAGIGAAIGGIGGLLVGLGALTIPGIGPVIAAGPLAVALSTLTGAGVGAVAGGVTGGLLGALIGLGIPEEEAEYYAEGIRRGGVLLTVQADDYNTEQIITILNHHNPMDINQRASEWREQGWSGFDPSRDPMTETDRPTMVPQTGAGPIDISAGTMDVDQVDTGDFDATRYRTHYNTYLSGSGYPYDYYIPAYQYGHELRRDARYQNRSWDEIEYDVHRDWERDHPGTWERFKASIRNAWEDITH